jgi:hypothetical protein
LSITPKVTTLHKDENNESDVPVFQTCAAAGDPFIQTICFVADPAYLAERKSDDLDHPNEYNDY